LFVATGSVIAAENLDSWGEYVEYGTVLFTPNGETLGFYIEGWVMETDGNISGEVSNLILLQ